MAQRQPQASIHVRERLEGLVEQGPERARRVMRLLSTSEAKRTGERRIAVPATTRFVKRNGLADNGGSPRVVCWRLRSHRLGGRSNWLTRHDSTDRREFDTASRL